MQAAQPTKKFFIYHPAPMATFQERITDAFQQENQRRLLAGEKKLTYTALWKAAKASSGAATHWFDGSNGMDMDTCFAVAPLLRVDPHWLFDESRPRIQKKDQERRISLVSTAAFSADEKRIIEGYRVADAKAKAIMLSIADQEIANFGRRSGEKSL